MQEQTKDALRRALQAAALPFAEEEPLAPHTTFRIGGPADWMFFPESEGCAQLFPGQRLQHAVCRRRV